MCLHELEIERLVAGGDGLARLEDGRIAFLPGAVPGDLVEAAIVEDRGSFVRGEIRSLLEEGPGRRPPPCPHASACGGCPWMHLEPEAQRHWKREVLREALRRTGGIDWDGPIPDHPSPEQGHRDRLRWKVRARQGSVHVGFHAPRSHRIVEVETCLLPPPGVEARLEALRRALRPYGADLSELREIVQDFHPAGDLHTLVFRKKRLPASLRDLAEALREATGAAGVAALPRGRPDPVPLAGASEIERESAGLRYRVHGGVFFQSNTSLRGALLRRVAELAAEGDGLCLDLYAGVGFLSLPLAARFDRVLGIESGVEAVRLARANAAANAVSNATFQQEETAQWLQGTELPGPQVVVSDPPRDGLGLEAAGRVAELGQERTVLVACDPVSLARDLGAFLERGHRIESMEIFDFFPGTWHMEVVAGLRCD